MAVIAIAATISVGMLAYIASSEKQLVKQKQQELQKLLSIPEVPILSLRSPSAILPHQYASVLVFLRGVVLPRSSVENKVVGQVSPSSVVEPLRSATTGREAVVVNSRTKHISTQKWEEIGELIISSSQEEAMKIGEFVILSSQEESNEKNAKKVASISRRNRKTERVKVISDSRRQVPFVIAPSNQCNDDYVLVNLDGAEAEVPLEKHSERKEIAYRTYKDYEQIDDEVCEEEVLHVGTEINALGLLSSENGIPTIKRHQGLPFFLSTTKSKDQLIAQLSADLKSSSSMDWFLSCMSVGAACGAIGAFITHATRR